VGIGLSTCLQKVCFGFGGDNLTHKLRVQLFDALLRKHVGWYDDKQKAPGILSNILTESINSINGLTTEAVGILIEAALGLTISCAICFYFSWRLATMVTLISPFMVLGGLGMSKL
jgi:ABC-type multidrug transport system fused ATPase/permease subunit